MADYEKCSKCGCDFDDYGWFDSEGNLICGDCEPDCLDGCFEVRVCIHCLNAMTCGMTDLESVYLHEECFGFWIAENQTKDPDWILILNDNDGSDVDGGYYDWLNVKTGDRFDSGIFYTEWR